MRSHTFAMIPARAGSKRCPEKNTRPFAGGESLMERTIRVALESHLFGAVVVSSEDNRTLLMATRIGAEMLHRPKSLAADDVDTEAVMNHAIATYPQYKIMCVLYCQAGAFVTPGMLQDSYTRFDMRNPLVSWVIELNKDAGQFYWVNTLRFQRAWGAGKQLLSQNIEEWPMPASEVQDINTEADWKLAEMKYRKLVDR